MPKKGIYVIFFYKVPHLRLLSVVNFRTSLRTNFSIFTILPLINASKYFSYKLFGFGTFSHNYFFANFMYIVPQISWDNFLIQNTSIWYLYNLFNYQTYYHFMITLLIFNWCSHHHSYLWFVLSFLIVYSLLPH